MAREKSRWNHTSAVLAEIMNGPRQKPDMRPWTAADLHPLREPIPVIQVSPRELTQALRSIWISRRGA